MAEPQPSPSKREFRFVPETTTSPSYTCWVLYFGDSILGSVITRSEVPEAEARAELSAKMRWEADFWALVDRLAP